VPKLDKKHKVIGRHRESITLRCHLHRRTSNLVATSLSSGSPPSYHQGMHIVGFTHPSGSTQKRQYWACSCHLLCGVVLVNMIILLCRDYPILKLCPFSSMFRVCVTYSPLKKFIVIFMHDFGARTFRSFINLFSHLLMAMSTED
jgi:hypothetical protein